jgi:hypothetical protein
VLEEDLSFERIIKRCMGEFRKNGVINSFTRNQIDCLTTNWLQRSGSLLVGFVGRLKSACSGRRSSGSTLHAQAFCTQRLPLSSLL